MAAPMTAQQAIKALRDEGVTVRELEGWETHNRNHVGTFQPNGVQVHGTGDAAVIPYDRQDEYMFNILFSGHGGLPGPLCNVGVDTEGIAYMTGWGRANHSGKGDGDILAKVIAGTLSLTGNETPGADDVDMNTRLYSMEIIQAGRTRITEAQYATAVLICAAWCRVHGWTGQDALAHKESTRRKPEDPPGINMGQFRRDVIARVKAGPARVNAIEVGGRIGQRWLELGGESGPLGAPIGGEVATERGALRRFAGGFMLWTVDTDARPSLYGPIRDRYGDYGFEGGVLGYPITDVEDARDGGRWQAYENGSIYWHQDTDAHAVYGAIGAVWAGQRHEHGPLGFPTSDEFDGAKPGRVQRFQGGTVYWSTKTGAHIVWGLILGEYARNGWEGGSLGYPVGPERSTADAWVQAFDGGEIRIAKPVVPVPKAIVSPGVGSPVPGARVTARYGQAPRNDTYWQSAKRLAAFRRPAHTGDDFAGAPGVEGQPVLAVADGYVTIGEDSVLGCKTFLHGDNGRVYTYCHLQRGSRSPWNGERVKAGQQIARLGQTGTGAAGPHLHLEDGTSTTWGVGIRKPEWPGRTLY